MTDITLDPSSPRGRLYAAYGPMCYPRPEPIFGPGTPFSVTPYLVDLDPLVKAFTDLWWEMQARARLAPYRLAHFQCADPACHIQAGPYCSRCGPVWTDGRRIRTAQPY